MWPQKRSTSVGFTGQHRRIRRSSSVGNRGHVPSEYTVKDGASARRAAVEKAIAGLGGRLEAFYYAFGRTDLFVIADLPDNASAAAMALTVAQSGLASTTTTVLLTVDDIDAATRKSVSYRPPGR